MQKYSTAEIVDKLRDMAYALENCDGHLVTYTETYAEERVHSATYDEERDHNTFLFQHEHTGQLRVAFTIQILAPAEEEG